jgi:DNA-binding response OmpR family regulator
MTRTVLIVEDDTAIRRGVADALRFSGYEVLTAKDGLEAIHLATSAHFGMALLDLALPGATGFEVLAAIQHAHPGLPVIILSARGEEADRVRGLKLGADDYIVKPFSIRELVARVEAVFRRSPERQLPEETIQFFGGQILLTSLRINHLDGSCTELSLREAAFLKYLAEHRGRAISREELLLRLWGVDGKKTETRAIDMHVANLRVKLRENADEPQFLKTVRGRGYAMERPS